MGIDSFLPNLCFRLHHYSICVKASQAPRSRHGVLAWIKFLYNNRANQVGKVGDGREVGSQRTILMAEPTTIKHPSLAFGILKLTRLISISRFPTKPTLKSGLCSGTPPSTWQLTTDRSRWPGCSWKLEQLRTRRIFRWDRSDQIFAQSWASHCHRYFDSAFDRILYFSHKQDSSKIFRRRWQRDPLKLVGHVMNNSW